jgi:hypothetical protein
MKNPQAESHEAGEKLSLIQIKLYTEVLNG